MIPPAVSIAVIGVVTALCVGNLRALENADE
jgi:hypothetical protein